MARKTSDDYDQTKRRLLEVGLAHFEQKGYNATGLQEIATDAGISKGSFYSYFASKEDFGVNVIRYYTEGSLKDWQRRLDEGVEESDGYKALILSFLKMTDHYQNSEMKKGCLIGNLSAEVSEASEACRVALTSSVSQYIAILTVHIAIGQSLGKVRQDVKAQRLAELLWDCWQGGLLRMQIKQSVEPVVNDLDLIFETLLL